MPRIVSPTHHLHWVKARVSMNTGACVEFAALRPGVVAMRDSKTDQRPLVSGAVPEMIATAKLGGFDALLPPEA